MIKMIYFVLGFLIVYRYHIKEIIIKQSLTMIVTKMIGALNFEVDKVITSDDFCNISVIIDVL
jgi:hypothetical protein